MKATTFNQLIDHLIKKGVDSIKITRSNRFCGCIKPNDIISIEVCKNGNIYLSSVSHVFDNPIIDVDRIIRDKNGCCIARWTIGQFIYSK